MDRLEHLDDWLDAFQQFVIALFLKCTLQLALADGYESLFGPFSKPVEDAAIHQRREHPESG